MRIAVVGGGPGGLYFAALVKQLDPRHEITVWERNAARRHVRLRRRLLRRDARRHRARRRGDPRADGAAVRPLGRHRRPLRGRGRHQRRARLRRDEPPAAAATSSSERCADLGVTVHFRTEAPDTDAAAAGLRPGGRRRRRSTPPSAAPVRATVRPDAWTGAPQVHLVRHRPGLRRVHSSTSARRRRRDAGARLPVRRRRLARSSSR